MSPLSKVFGPVPRLGILSNVSMILIAAHNNETELSVWSKAAMNCKKATKSYEDWLAKHTRTIEADLLLKHQQMSADVFSFMRATFYRWVELCAEQCADLAKAP